MDSKPSALAGCGAQKKPANVSASVPLHAAILNAFMMSLPFAWIPACCSRLLRRLGGLTLGWSSNPFSLWFAPIFLAVTSVTSPREAAFEDSSSSQNAHRQECLCYQKRLPAIWLVVR